MIPLLEDLLRDESQNEAWSESGDGAWSESENASWNGSEKKKWNESEKRSGNPLRSEAWNPLKNEAWNPSEKKAWNPSEKKAWNPSENPSENPPQPLSTATLSLSPTPFESAALLCLLLMLPSFPSLLPFLHRRLSALLALPFDSLLADLLYSANSLQNSPDFTEALLVKAAEGLRSPLRPASRAFLSDAVRRYVASHAVPRDCWCSLCARRGGSSVGLPRSVCRRARAWRRRCRSCWCHQCQPVGSHRRCCRRCCSVWCTRPRRSRCWRSGCWRNSSARRPTRTRCSTGASPTAFWAFRCRRATPRRSARRRTCSRSCRRRS